MSAASRRAPCELPSLAAAFALAAVVAAACGTGLSKITTAGPTQFAASLAIRKRGTPRCAALHGPFVLLLLRRSTASAGGTKTRSTGTQKPCVWQPVQNWARKGVISGSVKFERRHLACEISAPQQQLSCIYMYHAATRTPLLFDGENVAKSSMRRTPS